MSTKSEQSASGLKTFLPKSPPLNSMYRPIRAMKGVLSGHGLRELLYQEPMNGKLVIGDFDPEILAASATAWHQGQIVNIPSLGRNGIVQKYTLECVYVDIEGEVFKCQPGDLRAVKPKIIEMSPGYLK